MHYEINVSKDGQHVFATHPRSVTTEREAARLYVLFEQAFPPADGFRTTCTRHEETGTLLRPDQLPLSTRDAVWAKPAERLADANDKPPRYWVIAGRMHGDDEDMLRGYDNCNEAAARAAFIEDMWALEKADPEHRAAAEKAGEGVLITSAARSHSPIRVA